LFFLFVSSSLNFHSDTHVLYCSDDHNFFGFSSTSNEIGPISLR